MSFFNSPYDLNPASGPNWYFSTNLSVSGGLSKPSCAVAFTPYSLQCRHGAESDLQVTPAPPPGQSLPHCSQHYFAEDEVLLKSLLSADQCTIDSSCVEGTEMLQKSVVQLTHPLQQNFCSGRGLCEVLPGGCWCPWSSMLAAKGR